MSPQRRIPIIAALSALSILVFAYSLIIAQQILLGVLAIAAVWMGYLFYRFVTVLSRIATALEQLVAQRADDVGQRSRYDD